MEGNGPVELFVSNFTMAPRDQGSNPYRGLIIIVVFVCSKYRLWMVKKRAFCWRANIKKNCLVATIILYLESGHLPPNLTVS